jgi:hypothetical protein
VRSWLKDKIENVKPKVPPQTGAKAMTVPVSVIPSMTDVVGFFYSVPEIQVSYAQQSAAKLLAFAKNPKLPYPKEINTPSDIADFCLKNRHVKIDSIGDSLAGAFMSLVINDAKRKKKSEKPVTESPDKKKQVVKKDEQKATPIAAKTLRDMDKKAMEIPLLSIPGAVKFFSQPRASVFSSVGGLHDTSCGVCLEVGFYNIKAGERRGLTLAQKRWAEALHQTINPDGRSIFDMGALEGCEKFLPNANTAEDVTMTQSELADAILNGKSDWAEQMEGSSTM